MFFLCLPMKIKKMRNISIHFFVKQREGCSRPELTFTSQYPVGDEAVVVVGVFFSGVKGCVGIIKPADFFSLMEAKTFTVVLLVADGATQDLWGMLRVNSLSPGSRKAWRGAAALSH